MTDEELLTEVKNMLGITGEGLDATLKPYIYEVKRFCKSAGVKDTVISSRSIVGIVARGVADLWNYGGSPNIDYSQAFYKMLTQLRFEDGEQEAVEEFRPLSDEEIDSIVVWEH